MPEPTVGERRPLLDGCHLRVRATDAPTSGTPLRADMGGGLVRLVSIGCSSPGAHDPPNPPLSPFAKLGAHNDDGFGRSRKRNMRSGAERGRAADPVIGDTSPR
jgi:hypothetical protein